MSFTLLGLWWLVVHSRYQRGEGALAQRRHAYGIALFFLLPGVMSLIAAINSDLSALWRLGLRPQEAESVLVGLLLLVGANLACVGLTEAAETAGA